MSRAWPASSINSELVEVTVPAGDKTNGEALVDAYTEFGADLLIKGAYTHNRLRQMVFGGATRHVLNYAEIPVFMAR